MCIGFWSLTHPDYSLVLCSNRDEYLSRPTDPAHWHSFDPPQVSTPPSSTFDQQVDSREFHNEGDSVGFVLSGIDTLAGGTWFGINRRGDVALITNITEPTTKLTSSRGHLCSSFLLRNRSISQELTLPQFVEQLTASKTRYAGFNMLLLTPERTLPSATDGAKHHTFEYETAMLSNGGAGNPIRSISPSENSGGFGCISNDTMTGVDAFTGLKTETEWLKAAKGRGLFSNILSRSENETDEVLVEQLFQMMRTKGQSSPQNRKEFQETIMVDAVDLLGLRRGPSFMQTVRNFEDIRYEGKMSDKAHPESTTTSSGSNPNESKYYATRLSSVLLIRKDGRALFVERDVWTTDKDGNPSLIEQGGQRGHHERRYSFQIG